MNILEVLAPVVTETLNAVQIIKDYVGSGRTERAFRGVRFDRKLTKALKSLDEASKVFKMAVSANLHTLVLGMKDFLQTIRNDVQEVQAAQIAVQRDYLYSDIRAWFNAHENDDASSRIHERNLCNRHEGSGDWLLSHEAFKNWSDGTQVKLWLRGSPGAGKSFLCSKAIESVSSNPCNICLYYFYPIAGSRDNEKTGSAVEITSLLVDQLFRYFWRQNQNIVVPIGGYIRDRSRTMESLANVVLLILRHGNQKDGEPRSSLHTAAVRLYLFLDGPDESVDPHAAREILMAFERIDEQLSVVQKSWVSSRDTNELGFLRQWEVISVDEHAEADVKGFLLSSAPRFPNITEVNRDLEGQTFDEWVLLRLQERSNGNFLCARLMIQDLEELMTVADVVAFVESEVPKGFGESYRHIFRKYREDQHKYVSLLFSLVAFARRPLHLSEIQEAIALALSDPAKGLDNSKSPFRLPLLFAPLIEIQNDPEEPENPTCSLCHSTVYEFLVMNPDVLRIGDSTHTPFTYNISASHIGDLFLRYLSLDRYSKLLQVPSDNSHMPTNLGFYDAKNHGILSYSAKYWDRHLDDMEPTPERHQELWVFLRSPNFQTLLQIQSLLVAGHFSQFQHRDKSENLGLLHRRVFPLWFGWDTGCIDEDYCNEIERIRGDYRHFVWEWGHLLEHGTCESPHPGSDSRQCVAGGVDSCLSGLLGPNHFMQNLKERYPSFMLAHGRFQYHKSKQFVIGDTVSATGSQFIVISSPSHDSVDVCLDMWDLESTNTPQLISTRTISTKFDFKSNNGRSVTFSHAIASFISEHQDHESTFFADQLNADAKYEPLSTDFDTRDGIVVVATRNIHKRTRKQKMHKNVRIFRGNVEPLENSDFDSSEDESEEDSRYEYSSTSSDDDFESACETCSEGSTDFDSDTSEREGSEDEKDEDEEDEDESSEPEEEFDHSSGTGEEQRNPETRWAERVMFNYQETAESKLDLDEELLKPTTKDRPTYPGVPDRFKSPNDRITASLSVYDVKSDNEVCMFRFKRIAPAMLWR
uniref:Zinc finger protein n=1 Tax=Colletotrichum fructicola (strain Nara gc5) TaxID=1213859 RepID=L2FH03_COLFN